CQGLRHFTNPINSYLIVDMDGGAVGQDTDATDAGVVFAHDLPPLGLCVRDAREITQRAFSILCVQVTAAYRSDETSPDSKKPLVDGLTTKKPCHTRGSTCCSTVPRCPCHAGP